MRREYGWAVLAIVLGAGMGALSIRWMSPGAPGNGPAGATDPESKGTEAARAMTLEEMVADLSVDASRADALVQLKKVPYPRMERLRQLARETVDPRVVADLERQMEALQEAMAAGPPPISIHVKDGSLADVIGALNEEMGTEIAPGPVPLVVPKTFTVQETDKPFWEVVLAAADQHPVSYNALRDQLFLAEDLRGMPFRAVAGPFCMYASVRDNQPVPGGRTLATTRPLRWTLRYTLGVDPRLWAILGEPLKVTASGDDAGNMLVAAGESFLPHPMYLWGNSFYGEAEFVPPAHPGKTMGSVKVEGKIQVVSSELETAVDFAEPGDRDFTLGDASVSVKCFLRPQIPRTDFQISVKTREGKGGMAKIRLLDHPEIRVSYPFTVNGAYNFYFPMVPSPAFRLEVRVPRKVEDRGVSLEVKGLPLPALPA